MKECPISKKELAAMFDHTQLKAFAQKSDLERLCAEGRENGFKAVVVNPAQVALCRRLLQDAPVAIGATISFPLGQTTVEDKVSEARRAIANGADEIDYVINISQIKDGNSEYIRREMEAVVSLCREHGALSKVIFENCYLTEDEKRKLCEIAVQVRPDFIKTSTGFGTGGATVEDVRLMSSLTKGAVQVKAAGGIRDLDTCLAMIEAGASRIGTSSGVKILREYEERFGKTE